MREESVRPQGFLEISAESQKLGFVIAKDFFIAGLIGRPQRQTMLNVLQRLRELAGLELTQSPQCKSWSGVRSQCDEVRQGVAASGKLTGAVLEQSQGPPTLRPI